MFRIFLVSAVIALSFATAVAGSSERDDADGVVAGHRMAAAPTIDGAIDLEEEWNHVPGGTGFVDSDSGLKAINETRFWLAYDDKYVYFAAKCFDPNPAGIQATEYRANVSLGGNDFITLMLDPFGNLDNFSSFSVNPRGATTIVIGGGRAAKREWLGEIKAAGRVTAEGYEVEARIPWQLMHLPPAGERSLRFNVRRHDPRLSRNFAWRSTQGDRSLDYGRWTGVVLPDVKDPNVLKLLPYVYGGFDSKKDGIANAGLDLRTKLTDQIDVVGTINPDFRNIENQVLSLDFSYFERLTNESRPFFQEGRQYYSIASFGDNSPRIYASQRIRRMDGGLSVFGKLNNKLSAAVLNTNREGKENALVTTWKYTPSSSVEMAFGTANVDQKGMHNRASHVNIGAQIGKYYGYATAMDTVDSSVGSGRLRNVGVYANDGRSFEGVFEYVEASPRLNPRLGFVRETNYKGFAGFLETSRTYSFGALGETSFSVNGDWFDKFTGGKYRRSIEGSASLTWRDGLDLDFGVYRADFRNNADVLYFVSLERPRGNPYRRWEVGYSQGKLEGTRYRSVSITFHHRPLSPLQISASFEHADHKGKEQQGIFSAVYDLGRDQTISGRAVWRRGDVNAYLAYRRSGNKGMETFVILGDPNARTFQSSLVVKVVIPLEVPIGKR